MTRPGDARGRLRALLDAVEEAILKASDQEILEDIHDEGRDPQKVADEAGKIISCRIAAHRKRKLAAARESYRRAISNVVRPVRSLPDDPAEQRALLASVIASNAGIPQAITMAFRDGKHMTDKDVRSTLEDLAELGFLDDALDKP